ncbi:MAG: MFS transporter [Lachnospiraceae bacterium]
MENNHETKTKETPGRGRRSKNPDKLGFGTLFLWCGNGASLAVQAVLIGYVTIYCTNALGMSAAVVGTLLMVSKIFDGITDLFAGFIVDRTNTRIGRGRPYDLCIIGLWVTTWLLFSVPASMTVTMKCVWIFICYTLCQSVFKTFLSAAGTPYMVRAFNNDQKYVKLSSWGGLLTTCVVIVFNVIFPMFYAGIVGNAAGWSSLIAYIAIPLCILGILRFFFIPEKYKVDNRHEETTLKDIAKVLKTNPNIYPVAILYLIVGITGNISVAGYYYLYIVKDLAISGVMSLFTVFAMISLAFYPAILKKITNKQLIQYSLLLSIPAAVINFLALDRLPMLAVGSILLGLAQLPISYMSGILIIDCADFNEYIGNPRMEGTMGSVTGFANKIGQALGTFLLGVLLTSSGFDGTLDVQPASAIWMIRCVNAFLPAVFMILGSICLHFYRIDQKKEEISTAIRAKRESV